MTPDQIARYKNTYDSNVFIQEQFGSFDDFLASQNPQTQGPASTTTDSTGLGLGGLVDPAWGSGAQGTLDAGINRANSTFNKDAHNTDTVQGSQQAGAFQTNNNTAQTSLNASQQNQTGTQDQTTANTGLSSTNQTSVGQQNSNNIGLTSNNTLQQGTTANAGTTTNDGTSSNLSQGATSNMGQTAQTNQSNGQTSNVGQTNDSTNSSGSQVSNTLGSTTNNGATTGLSNSVGQSATSNLGSTSNQGVTSNQGSTTSQGISNNLGQTSSTSGVVDTLGLGNLISGQAQGAIASDAERAAFLKDVMNNGGTGFNQQLAAGINSAMSGPGMQGVGNGAVGRVAGSAAADVGRNNLNQRLSASQQLAGPTLFSQMASLGNPYLGQTNTGTTSNTGSVLNTGTSSEKGTSSTLGTSQSQGLSNTNEANSTSGTSANTGTSNSTTAAANNNSSNTVGNSSQIGNNSNSSTALGNSISQGLSNQSNTGSSSNTGTSANTGFNSSGTLNSGTSQNIGSQTSSNSTLTDSLTSALSSLKGTNTSNTSGLNLGSIVGSESQSGTSAANSLQAATGNTPQVEQKGGGCYVCTAFVELGRMDANEVRTAARWKLEHLGQFGTSLHGYSIYGPWLARKVRKYRIVQNLLFKFCKKILDHELYFAGTKRWTLSNSLCHAVFHLGSIPWSWGARLFGRRAITTSRVDFELLKKQQLEFQFFHKV